VQDQISLLLNLSEVESGKDGWDKINSCVPIDCHAMRRTREDFTRSDEVELMRHFAQNLVDKHGNACLAGVIIENVFNWLSNADAAVLVHTFVEALFVHSVSDDVLTASFEHIRKSCRTVSPSQVRSHELSSLMYCEFGLNLLEYSRCHHGVNTSFEGLLKEIANELNSFSDDNCVGTKLSQLHFFSVYAHLTGDYTAFNHFIAHHGHVVFEYLFDRVDSREFLTEDHRFFIESLTYILAADQVSQGVIGDCFKLQLIKNAEGLCHLCMMFADSLSDQEDLIFSKAARTFVGLVWDMIVDVSHHENLGLQSRLTRILFKFSHWSFFPNFIGDSLLDPGSPIPLRLSKRRRRQLLASSYLHQPTENRCVRCVQCCG
jgi:hypothetical protein